MKVNLTVHSVGTGKDSLSGRQTDGITVAFGDGTPRFLSWKSLKSLICYEMHPAPKDEEEPPLFRGNGIPEATVVK